MNELTTLTLAQIVNSNHRAAAVLEKYHLDFCCKGKRSLQQACTEQQLSVNEISKELESIFTQNEKADIDFDEMSLGSLCDYIVTKHHEYVKNELPLIYAYLHKVSTKHGDRHPELHKIFQTFAAVKEEMESHMKKEEVILFPRIKELETLADKKINVPVNISYFQSPIRVMEQEHDHAGSLLIEIRLLTDDYYPPADACTTYRLSFASLRNFELDLHQHVHLENNILFPRTLQLFNKLTNHFLN